ncbi:hypothetical protein [Olleya sp. HaHaR_3_96]|uniref:hypothetical protein n=1 Tax=Olleya sp. HaHaR_3_96 TaxID=2745560 RepID=UPI001C4EA0EC|nr:hypothetical protein [Olleya sp. HaHaR_3_96]QXP61646.1 hypothetical protein H0I26_08455 [Olleya sp. HaHaR_3_96]
MKQTTLIITTFLCLNFCLSQTQKKVINGIEFEIITTSVDEDQQTDFIELYRNDKKLLQHTLYDSDGDCSSENIELGTHKITDNTLIFYSYWASADRMMKNIYPYGFRKQIYYVTPKGTVSLESSQLYIEAYVDEWHVHQGMQYLNNKPKTNEEKESLKDYILKAEQMYDGHFVFGENKSVLENEVRQELAEAITENTKYWKAVYGENCKM